MTANAEPEQDELPEFVHKICRAEEWAELRAAGSWSGSPDDARDGFIHLSTGAQVAGTLARHFAGQTGLWLLTLRREQLGDALKFEPSRGGQLFPHLYGRLELGRVVEQVALEGNSAPTGLA